MSQFLKQFLFLSSFVVSSHVFANNPILLDSKEYLEEVKAGRIILDSEQQRLADRKKQETQQKEYDLVLQQQIAKKPILAKKLYPKLSSGIKDQGNGSYAIDLACRNPNGCPSVLTVSMDEVRKDYAATYLELQKEKNLDHQYQFLIEGLLRFQKNYPSIQIKTLNKVDVSKLPTQQQFVTLKKEDKLRFLSAFKNKSEVLKLHDQIKNLIPPRDPQSLFNSCQNEIGQGNISDIPGDRLVNSGSGNAADGRVTQRCSEHYEESSMDYLKFPMKPYLTCVKNQSARGTCWSFALNSGIESALARIHHEKNGRVKFYNFSEQALVFSVKSILNPDPDRFKEGEANSFIDRLINARTLIPLENAWQFNQSRRRDVDEDAKTYAFSCANYDATNRYCSNTNHQGLLVCAHLPGQTQCGFRATPAAQRPVESIQLTSSGQIWDENDPEASATLSLFAMLFNTPLYMSFNVPPEFYKMKDGWIPPKHVFNLEQETLGGHAVHLVGFVSDEALSKIPEVADKVDTNTGGGYVIIKNSWGPCHGDRGYVYMPLSMYMEHTYSMRTITGIQ